MMAKKALTAIGVGCLLLMAGCSSSGSPDEIPPGETREAEPATAEAPDIAPAYKLTRPYPRVPYPETAEVEFDSFKDCDGGILDTEPYCSEEGGYSDRLLELSVPGVSLEQINAWYDKYLPPRATGGWEYCEETSGIEGLEIYRDFYKLKPGPINSYEDEHYFRVETSEVELDPTYDADTQQEGPRSAAGISIDFGSFLGCTSLEEVETTSSLPGLGVEVNIGETGYNINNAESISRKPCGFGRGFVDPKDRFIILDLEIINQGTNPLRIREDTGYLIDGQGKKYLRQAQKPIRKECVTLHDLSEPLGPGESQEGELIYDVPFKAVAGSKMRLKDQGSEKTVDIDLDLSPGN